MSCPPFGSQIGSQKDTRVYPRDPMYRVTIIPSGRIKSFSDEECQILGLQGALVRQFITLWGQFITPLCCLDESVID